MATLETLRIFDGHNDFSMRLENAQGEADYSLFFNRNSEGHIDLPRAEEGGLCGGLFAIFVEPPASSESQDDATKRRLRMQPLQFDFALSVTNRRIAMLKELATRSDGSVAIATTVSEIERAYSAGRFAIVLHLEGAESVEPSLKNLETLYGAGVRSIGLVWSRPDAFGFGVPFDFPGSPDSGPGLTDAGKELVRSCNRLGIMVDVSHLNEKGFWDVERLSEKPIVATHSNVHSLCPTPRNLTDRQIDAIGASDGVIGLNYAIQFLRRDGQKNTDTQLSVMADHVAYIAERIGVEHIALGSDFDGATISKELGDVSGLPKLMDALRARGFNGEELEMIARKNWLRVLARTWR